MKENKQMKKNLILMIYMMNLKMKKNRQKLINNWPINLMIWKWIQKLIWKSMLNRLRKINNNKFKAIKLFQKIKTKKIIIKNKINKKQQTKKMTNYKYKIDLLKIYKQI